MRVKLTKGVFSVRKKVTITLSIVLAITIFLIYSAAVTGTEHFPFSDDESSSEMIIYTKGANVFKVINKVEMIYYDTYIDDQVEGSEELPGYSMKEKGDDVVVTLIPGKMTIESWSELVGYDLSEYVDEADVKPHVIKYNEFMILAKELGLIE